MATLSRECRRNDFPTSIRIGYRPSDGQSNPPPCPVPAIPPAHAQARMLGWAVSVGKVSPARPFGKQLAAPHPLRRKAHRDGWILFFLRMPICRKFPYSYEYQTIDPVDARLTQCQPCQLEAAIPAAARPKGLQCGFRSVPGRETSILGRNYT